MRGPAGELPGEWLPNLDRLGTRALIRRAKLSMASRIRSSAGGLPGGAAAGAFFGGCRREVQAGFKESHPFFRAALRPW